VADGVFRRGIPISEPYTSDNHRLVIKNTFAVFLSTLTSTQCHCLLEWGKVYYPCLLVQRNQLNLLKQLSPISLQTGSSSR